VTGPAGRARLDLVLVERGLARTRSHAQALVREGAVRVDGVVVQRPGELVSAGAEVSARSDPYVSRAASKLVGALDDLGLQVGGRALDAGASTGGFTQVLLQRGCRQVHAVDVGTDQLVPSLRADPRVVVHEQTNLRDLRLEQLDGEPVDLTVADVSFISLTLLVAPLAAVTDPAGTMLLMVKPQFEVGRERLGRGGVVRSAREHADAVVSVARAAAVHGWHAAAVRRSRLPGPAGNQEFFLLLRTSPPADPLDVAAAVVAASTPG
jgi:23S rRNA (cytidine1920-2'-O)/16S rRNA (cytidine1409-2'-O)-methyltransferase